MPRMTDLPNIPQTPGEGAHWQSGVPFAQYPAAAHAMLHPDRVGESRYSVVDYMTRMRGSNNPYYLMQRYWPAGADQAAALRGLGADEGSGLLKAIAVGIAAGAVLGLGASAAAGYYAGKAVAPTDEKATTYGFIGLLVGLASAVAPYPVTVPAGVGAMAAVSHHLANRG